MIPVNELRIGSLVLINNEIENIDWIDFEHLLPVNHENYFRPNGQLLRDIYPIPLTPEVLEKCGFVKMGGHWSLGIIHFIPGMVCYYDKVRMSHIQNLHQLQNLYFALTGTELKYTP